MGRVVVGVDGSPNSRAALRWAVAHARGTGDAIEAVLAWTEPYAVGEAFPGVVLEPVDLEKFERSHREELHRIVESTDTSGLDQPVEEIVAMGGAAQTLLDVAKGADLVVLGSRGRGGFVGLLLGSVTQQVANHAPCPVVIVPANDRYGPER